MIGWILVGVITAAAVGVLAAFWDEIISFLKSALEKVKRIVKGVVYGTKVFIKKIREAYQEIARYYTRVEEHWQETTVTREVSEEEVPEEIRALVTGSNEVDITPQLELVMENA